MKRVFSAIASTIYYLGAIIAPFWVSMQVAAHYANNGSIAWEFITWSLFGLYIISFAYISYLDLKSSEKKEESNKSLVSGGASANDVEQSATARRALDEMDISPNRPSRYAGIDYEKHIRGEESFTEQQEKYRDFLKQLLIKKTENGWPNVVQVLANDDACEACKKISGKKYTLEDALKEMPLPCKCTKKIFSKAPEGLCRCFYISIFEKSK